MLNNLLFYAEWAKTTKKEAYPPNEPEVDAKIDGVDDTALPKTPCVYLRWMWVFVNYYCICLFLSLSAAPFYNSINLVT